MEPERSKGGAEVGRYEWEAEKTEIKEPKSKLGKNLCMIAGETHPMTVPQGDEIIGLLKGIKLELQSQKRPSEKEPKDISQIHERNTQLIEKLSKRMEEDPSKYYAISISKGDIIESSKSEWDLMSKIRKKGLEKDVFIYCPTENWF
ncbi:MAG: hypothetical protein A7316_01150 [Candidatus Altiarchaeales archaeon WOR_SM1_86-2]|nr:MAG: hypothetical protein A7316_01150 [Candidatus Altiarchaeales archaeon WOR_SM1_86-2]